MLHPFNYVLLQQLLGLKWLGKGDTSKNQVSSQELLGFQTSTHLVDCPPLPSNSAISLTSVWK